MSVVAPAVYVGTWHKYNCGSIAGRWFDLTTFDDERDFFAACRALHQDEADPELMFQDYEGFPGNMASECHINWAWVEGFRLARDEGCEEAYRLWVEDTGETDFDTFRDAWWGEADSEEAFAVEFASDTGLLADVPETALPAHLTVCKATAPDGAVNPSAATPAACFPLWTFRGLE
ncbi:antirestriction protein ArdA [Escherichia coli]|nr:antirestriction protein ArdA [Escherichia coli]